MSKKNARMLREAVERTNRPYDAAEEAKKARARLRREEGVAALRDGVKQRAWRKENGRAEAGRRACRGRVSDD